MRRNFSRLAAAFAVFALCLCASSLSIAENRATNASPDSRANAALAELASSGTLVYRGKTFAKDETAGEPLYRYERRVVAQSNRIIASHVTTDPAGRIVVVEAAALSDDYGLKRLEVNHPQQGFSGHVQTSDDGSSLVYELNQNGRVSTKTEMIAGPVVSGPSLFGFALKHRERLSAGAVIPVRMVVLKDKTTYGFDLRMEPQVSVQPQQQTHDRWVFTLTPSSFFVRLAVAPLRIEFDSRSASPVSYSGLVPPMRRRGEQLVSLDARVEYTAESATYR